MDIHRTPVHASLVRPPLIAGVERRIVILEATLALTILLGIGFHTFTLGVCALLAFGIHPILARVSRSDPQALAVYARALPQQSFYPRAVHPRARLHVHLPLTSRS